MGMEDSETIQGFPFAWKVRIFTFTQEIRTFLCVSFCGTDVIFLVTFIVVLQK